MKRASRCLLCVRSYKRASREACFILRKISPEVLESGNDRTFAGLFFARYLLFNVRDKASAQITTLNTYDEASARLVSACHEILGSLALVVFVRLKFISTIFFLFQFGHWPFAVAQGTYASKYAGAGYFFGKAFNNRKRVFVCSLGYFRSDVSSHLTKLAHLSCKGK